MHTTLSISLNTLLLLLAASPAAAAGGVRAERIASLEYVFYRQSSTHAGASPVDNPLAVALPDQAELKAFKRVKRQSDAKALDVLDKVYRRNDLKALAVRDSDGDGTPDFRISDYYGKFCEGDIDVDGDGVRNIYDSHPYDSELGGQDSDGDGIPDVAGTFRDTNSNGLPDHLDWSIHKDDPEIAEIQVGLFLDHKIILVERDAEFDLELARAVDDTIRGVFGYHFSQHGVLPTLRTVAVEKTALLNEKLAAKEGDNTSAQVFSQTQSLIIYDEGRAVKHAIGLLGLLAHEFGHNYQFSLDFDASNLPAENRRTDFPAPNFVSVVKQFGWATNGYDREDLGGDLALQPLFLYTGLSEPIFVLKGKSPEEWDEWLTEIYESIDKSPDYLQHEAILGEGIVGDYSVSTPYEWHSDNLLAYVLYVLEEEMRQSGTLTVPGATGQDGVSAAEEKITLALRKIWPGFYHRNIRDSEAFPYFRDHFPISKEHREALAERYLVPIVQASQQE